MSAINGGGADTSSDATATAPATPAAPTATSAAPAAESATPAESNYGQQNAKYGQEGTAGGVAVTVFAPKKVSAAYSGDQMCATVSYRNTGTTPEMFSSFDWKFRSTEGVDTDPSIPWNSKNSLDSGTLQPGGKTSGQICAGDSISPMPNVTSVIYSPGFGIMHEVTWSK